MSANERGKDAKGGRETERERERGREREMHEQIER